jgi:hypothetical protein
MADSSSYKRYGIRSENPMMGLVAGQNAVNNSLNDAINSVGDLLGQQETRYKDENTINMQQYLQKKIASEGLGADPIDTIGIKKKFGNMVDMDTLGTTVANQKNILERAAVDDASKLATQALAENKDPVEARRIFEESLRGAKAKESLVSSATKAWSDSNATKIQDMATLKNRAESARTEQVLSALSNNMDQTMAIEAAVKDLPENEQAAARRKLEEQVIKASELTPQQLAEQKYLLEQNRIQGDRSIRSYEDAVGTLEAQRALLQDTGIEQGYYDQASSLKNRLGKGIVDEIGNKVTNWWEAWDPNNDTAKLREYRKSKIDDGAKSLDVDAAMSQAFSETFRDSNKFFKDLSTGELNELKARADTLITAKKNQHALDGRLTEARSALADEEARVATQHNKYGRDLLNAGIDKRLRKEGATGMKGVTDTFKSTLPNIGGTGAVRSSGGSGETGSSFSRVVNAGKGETVGETPAGATDKSGGKLTAEEELNNIKTYAKDREQIADRARAYTRESPQRLTPEPSSGDMTNPLDVQEVMRRNLLRSTDSVRAPQEKVMADAVKTAGSMIADYSPFGLGWKGIKNLSKSAQNAFTDFHNWAQDFADNRYKTPEAKKKASSEEVLQAYLEENPDFAKRMDKALAELNAEDKSSKK